MCVGRILDFFLFSMWECFHVYNVFICDWFEFGKSLCSVCVDVFMFTMFHLWLVWVFKMSVFCVCGTVFMLTMFSVWECFNVNNVFIVFGKCPWFVCVNVWCFQCFYCHWFEFGKCLCFLCVNVSMLTMFWLYWSNFGKMKSLCFVCGNVSMFIMFSLWVDWVW